MWAANVILVLAGLALLPRMERYWSEPSPLSFLARFIAWRRLLRNAVRVAKARTARAKRMARSFTNSFCSLRPIFPSIIDIYILRRFSYYFVLVLGAFILLFELYFLRTSRRHRAPPQSPSSSSWTISAS